MDVIGHVLLGIGALLLAIPGLLFLAWAGLVFAGRLRRSFKRGNARL